MSVPRKHHYVPRFYLSGFSEGKHLHVLDKRSWRNFSVNVEDAACERDYYMIEVEADGDPAELERFFGTFETSGAQALRQIVESQVLPPDEVLHEKLLPFVALMSVRGPGPRDAIERPFAEMMKQIMWLMTSSKEAYENNIKKVAEQTGADLSSVTYEEMRDFVRRGEYDIDMGQNFRMRTLLQMLVPVLELLSMRHWSLAVSSADSPDLICSDRPVSLSWNRAELVHPFFGPGFGVPETMVSMPLNRHLCLLGVFEEVEPHHVLSAEDVATLNTCTALQATRFVYSKADDFVVQLEDRAVGRAEFIDAVKAATESEQR